MDEAVRQAALRLAAQEYDAKVKAASEELNQARKAYYERVDRANAELHRAISGIGEEFADDETAATAGEE